MNAQSSESPGLNLPPPVVEQAPTPQSSPEAAPQQVEQAPLPSEKDPTHTQPAAPPLATVPLPLLPAAPQATAQVGSTPAAPSTVPLAADDTDLIEKEWVNKAKEIVERTRENPYAQSKELNLFKADYMKKRYNKTLKLSE